MSKTPLKSSFTPYLISKRLNLNPEEVERKWRRSKRLFRDSGGVKGDYLGIFLFTCKLLALKLKEPDSYSTISFQGRKYALISKSNPSYLEIQDIKTGSILHLPYVILLDAD